MLFRFPAICFGALVWYCVWMTQDGWIYQVYLCGKCRPPWTMVYDIWRRPPSSYPMIRSLLTLLRYKCDLRYLMAYTVYTIYATELTTVWCVLRVEVCAFIMFQYLFILCTVDIVAIMNGTLFGEYKNTPDQTNKIIFIKIECDTHTRAQFWPYRYRYWVFRTIVCCTGPITL